MAGYDVGPRTILLFWKYWTCLQMMTEDGGYFAPPLQGYCEVTQGDPLSPTIINVVVGVVIWQWATVVEPTEVEAEGLRETIQ